MSFHNKTDQYLSKQNTFNWKIIQKNENESFSNIIVIPAIAEFDNIKKLVGSLKSSNLKKIHKTLSLFIINNKEDDSEEIKKDNLKSIEFLKSINDENNLKFGFVDCSTKGNELPEKDAGAGFARKVGMDLALKYFDFEPNKKKLLISLDADCLVSENYIEVIQKSFCEKDYLAAVINFEHQLSDNFDQNLAIINYEIFLRYYILGLKFANSPFAFHTIGSAFTVNPEIYLKAGGMNKRKAGEDFYFLQKVAKITDIKKIANATVFPSSRISNRVPFGTGPRIKRFLENSTNEYLVYSPKSFVILRNWMELLNNQKFKNNLFSETKNIHPELSNFLTSQNFENAWKNILRNSKSENQLNQNIKNWMDGFRTLKLIHHLRDFAFPNEHMFESVNQLFEFYGKEQIKISGDKIPAYETQIQFLDELRKLT